MVQNLCLFRLVEAFNGSTVTDVMQSIVVTPGVPPKLVMPRKIQDNKKVLYRVSVLQLWPTGYQLIMTVLCCMPSIYAWQHRASRTVPYAHNRFKHSLNCALHPGKNTSALLALLHRPACKCIIRPECCNNLPAQPLQPPFSLCCAAHPFFPQLNLDPQQVVLALPSHVMACLLGYLSGVLKSGKQWSADLTDCTLTDSGPLEHVVRGGSVLVTFLELIPRFRCGRDHCAWLLCSSLACSQYTFCSPAWLS